MHIKNIKDIELIGSDPFSLVKRKNDREIYDLDSSSISLPEHFCVELDEIRRIPVTHAPGLYNEPNLIWESSDSSIVSVSDGVIKGLKIGTATITATDSDNMKIQASTVVEVTEVYGSTVILTVNSGYTSMGTVSGSGSYRKYTKATITATPEYGYMFVKWSDENTNATRTIEISEDKTLTATFRAPENYEILYTSTDGNVVTPLTPTSFGATIVSNVYQNGKGLITFDGDVTSIGNKAFGSNVNTSSCVNLKTIIIPETVTSTGYCAFGGCNNLERINIPKNLTSISSGLGFYTTYNLGIITVDSENTVYEDRECNAIIDKSTNTLIRGCKNTIIPDSVTSLANDAFSGTDLNELYISKYITSIGINTFEASRNLDKIVVDPENTVFDSRDNCNAIIETATDTLKFGCNNTIIPEGIVTIYSKAFYRREKIKTIEIPDTVTSIGRQAFYGCTSLTSVVIGNSVTSIGYGALAGCTSLTSIEIPNSVTSIGDYALWNCRLTSITSLNTTPPTLGSDVFLSVPDTCPIYVPSESVDLYKSASGWSSRADYIQAIQ